MGIDVKFKKKDIEKLIEDGNDRELCFLMLFEVYEEDAFSNLVIKKADRIAASYNKSLDFVRAMLYGTLTYSFTIDFLVRHITKGSTGRDGSCLKNSDKNGCLAAAVRKQHSGIRGM
ncbi:MAG: hypothetical protein LKM40_02525 [Mageeibacillus sp.]|jgi:16S rRNA (cytosine967-C5)-methyltransferase|nr:hypothetical protein [Mageeibacillus sp.]